MCATIHVQALYLGIGRAGNVLEFDCLVALGLLWYHTYNIHNYHPAEVRTRVVVKHVVVLVAIQTRFWDDFCTLFFLGH